MFQFETELRSFTLRNFIEEVSTPCWASSLTRTLRSFTLRNFIEERFLWAGSWWSAIAKLYASQLH